MTALDAALDYARMGIYVFPCNGKEPLVKWGTESTNNPETIHKWWTRWPNAAIGVDCGRTGLVIIDLDVKGGVDGPGNWKRRLNGHDVPHTFNVQTPSGGWHGWFRDPAGKYRNSAGQIAPGVDVRGVGGYVVAPGSNGYKWAAETPLTLDDIPVLPDGIIPTDPGGGGGAHWARLNRDELDPRDLAALEALEQLGGHGAYLSDGHIAITRPGKVAGASASIGHIGPGVVKIFTPNWPSLREDVYDSDGLTRIAKGNEEARRRIKLTPAATITPRRIKWLWDLRYARGILALLAGREGLGKSTFAYWIVARVTRGELPGDHHRQPRAVLICATEDSWEHTIVPRLIAAGADLRLVYRVEVVTADDITVGLILPRDLQDVEDAATRTNAALLLLDPLMSRISDSIDPHKDLEVRQALEPLTWVADRTGMTVLGIIHLNKTGSIDILDRVMGSKAFAAVARAVSAVVPDPDDEEGKRRLFGIPKNNLGRSDLPSIRFTIHGVDVETPEGPSEVGTVHVEDEVTLTIHEAMERNNQDLETRTITSDCARLIKDYLVEAGGGADSRDVKAAAKAAGFNDQAVRRGRQRLKLVIHNLPTSPRRTVWELPPSSPVVVSYSWGDSLTDTTDINAGQSHVSEMPDTSVRVNRVSREDPRARDTNGSWNQWPEGSFGAQANP